MEFVSSTIAILNSSPDIYQKDDEDGIAAGFSEFCAMVLLMVLIYTVNWELNFGKVCLNLQLHW